MAKERHPWRVEQRLLEWLERSFAPRSPAFVFNLSLTIVILIGVVDHFTGQLSLSVFYVLPLVLATWLLGKFRGALIALGAALVWLAADITAHIGEGVIPYWNALARFGVFFVIVSLVAALRDALAHEHDLAMQERDISEGLRGLNEMKDTLLHAVSHDLRNPLTAIIGSVQTLERGSQLQLTPDQTEGLLQAIDSSARKLHRMISDLLDLERLDRGDVAADRHPTDLRDLTRRMVQEATFLENHPARVESERVVLSVDRGKVERIIENLLVNAAKYTPTASPVCIRVNAVDGGAVISVEDEGPGVPDELKETIFQPFRQAEKGSAGAGIGLSLVAKFAELHGGRAWVEDRPGGGASFRIFLAAPEEEPADAQLRAVGA
ncbi:MAG: sensor histidine kinase [Actinomycetota bacterium]